MKADKFISKQEEDKLGRYYFAEEIAQNLLGSLDQESMDSMVISITGKWGSGKSSLLAFVKAEIEKKTNSFSGTVLTMNFNPWSYQDRKDLYTLFMYDLSEYLRTYKNGNKGVARLSKELSKLNDLFDNLIELNEENPEPTTKLITKVAGKVKNEIQKAINWKNNSSNRKKEIDEVFLTENLRAFVFIDDIDRLEPDEVLELFRFLKQNADFQNTIFILAFDKEQILDILNSRYNGRGAEYIEKIIQIDYDMPDVLPNSIKEVFFDLIRKITVDETCLKLLDVAWKDDLSNYFTTVRDVKRYYNSLKLRMTKRVDELFLFDYLILEAIRVFDYEAYRISPVYRSDILFINMKKSASQNVRKKEKLIHLLSGVIKNGTTTKLLAGISYGYGHTDRDSAKKNRRYATVEAFDKYYTLQMSSNDISKIVLNDFIKATSEHKRYSILSDHRESDKLVEFIDSLRLCVNDIVQYDLAEQVSSDLLNYVDDNELYNDEFVYKSVNYFIATLAFSFDSENANFEYLEAVIYGNTRISMMRVLWSGFLSNEIYVRNLDTFSSIDLIITQDETLRNRFYSYFKENIDRHFLSDSIEKPWLFTTEILQMILIVGNRDHRQNFKRIITNGVAKSINNLYYFKTHLSKVLVAGKGWYYRYNKDNVFQTFEHLSIGRLMEKIMTINESDCKKEELVILQLYKKMSALNFDDKTCYHMTTLEEFC